MAIDMKFGTPEFHATNTHPTGLHGKVELTNGSATVEAGKFTVSMLALSQDSSQESAGMTLTMDALAAGEVRHPEIGVQCDPGEWTVTFILTSADSSETLETDPQTVRIEGPTHHAAQFADSSKLQYTIEVTGVTSDLPHLVKVDYRLTNTGSVAILPGFPITLALSCRTDGSTSAQEYKIEVGVPKGASEVKFLHVECNHTNEGDVADLLFIGDQGGLATQEFPFTLTWKGDKTADFTKG